MEEESKSEETKANVLIKTKSEVERIIKQITESGLQIANVELLYKLIDIHKDIENEKYWKEKEEESMYRGRDYFMDDSYNGGRSRDSRGRYMDGSYGRRGVPGTGRSRYRGEEMIDDMYRNYEDYSEGKEMYGADGKTMESFKYMVKSFKDYYKHLKDNASSNEEVQILDQAIDEMARM